MKKLDKVAAAGLEPLSKKLHDRLNLIGKIFPDKPAAKADTTLRDRQMIEMARLDDEENTRLKRLVRGRLGAGSLLGRRSGGSAAPSSGGESAGRGGSWSYTGGGSARAQTGR